MPYLSSLSVLIGYQFKRGKANLQVSIKYGIVMRRTLFEIEVRKIIIERWRNKQNTIIYWHWPGGGSLCTYSSKWYHWVSWRNYQIGDLSKQMKPPVGNDDQHQKNQTKEVADNDESDTADNISELEDLSKNTKCHQQRMYNRRIVLLFSNQRRPNLIMGLKKAILMSTEERTTSHTVYQSKHESQRIYF